MTTTPLFIFFLLKLFPWLLKYPRNGPAAAAGAAHTSAGDGETGTNSRTTALGTAQHAVPALSPHSLLTQRTHCSPLVRVLHVPAASHFNQNSIQLHLLICLLLQHSGCLFFKGFSYLLIFHLPSFTGTENFSPLMPINLHLCSFFDKIVLTCFYISVPGKRCQIQKLWVNSSSEIRHL